MKIFLTLSKGSKGQKKLPAFCLYRIVAVLFFFSFSILFSFSYVFAQDKEKDQVIVSPHDFIQKNLNDFKAKLQRLKESYQDQYGSLVIGTSPVDVETISKELPKPTTLRLAVQSPGEKEEPKKQPIPGEDQFKYEYFLNNLSGIASVDRMYRLTDGYNSKEKGDTSMLVASDVKTSQLLGLPQKASLGAYGSIQYIGGKTQSQMGSYGEVCCISVARESYCAEYSGNKCIRTSFNEYCGKYAELPNIGHVWDDPRFYIKELNLNVAMAGDAKIDEKMKKVEFTSPGKKEIKLISSKKYSEEAEYKTYRSCIPQYSYRYSGGSYYSYSTPGLDKAVIGYKPAGDVSSEYRFTAVTFKKFGFPGYEIDKTHGKIQNMDYFFSDADTSRQSSLSFERLEPYVLLDFGNAGGLKAVRASDISAPITWSTIKTGPFYLAENGTVIYRGGAGESRFSFTLGGYETIERTITANTIEMVFDDLIKNNKISLGKNHKVIFRVKGPADMANYQVRWTGEGGSWAQSNTPFKKVGANWEAEGTYSISFDGAFTPAQLNKQAMMKAELIRMADNGKLYTYENKNLVTTYPSVETLELHAGIGDSPPKKVTEPIDFFVLYDSPKAVLVPKLSTKGEIYSLKDINPYMSVEFNSSNPAVVSVSSEQVRFYAGKPMLDIVARPGGRIGTAKVVAKLGDKSFIAGIKSELESNPVEFTVNTIYLFAESLSSDRTRYRLFVIGPANMSLYQARWGGEAARVTAFREDASGFVSELETTLRMDKVEIIKQGVSLAQFDVKNAAKRLNVKLVPPKPPVTVVKKVDVTNLGNLETITECKKQVRTQIELFGFDPGMAVEDYCRAEREKEKQKIKEQREDQKAFNRMLSDLNKQGQDLIIVSDTMRVGAIVKGDLTTMGGEIFCFWSLENNGGLAFQSNVTPIERLNLQEGACFNVIIGLKNGFDLNTVVKVDLGVPRKPNEPYIVSGEKVTAVGSTLYR